MEIPDKWLYEYAIIRYVPRPDRGESINIGLIMMNKRVKWMRGKVHIDETRIKNFYQAADIGALKFQSKLFEKNDVPQKDLPIEEKFRWLTAEKSAVIRVSPSHPGIVNIDNYLDMEKDEIKENKYREERSTDSIMELEFNRLFKELILPLK